MDLFSKTLSEIHLQSSLLALLTLRAPWGIDFESSSGSPAHYILSGEAWVDPGDGRPAHLQAGDLVMFPRWDRHSLASSKRAKVIAIRQALDQAGVQGWEPGSLLDHPIMMESGGDGEPTEIISMVFRLDEPERDPLLLSLPSFIHIRGDDARMTTWLQPALAFLKEETQGLRRGYAVVAQRLAELLFMQIIRAQLVLRPDEAEGWLRGLSDPAVGCALAAMHAAPGENWTVASLAAQAGLSRSAFAARFRDLLATSPMDYLGGLRMRVAADKLARGVPVKVLTEELGYATPFAFSNAFKRRYGRPPGLYSRQNRTAP